MSKKELNHEYRVHGVSAITDVSIAVALIAVLVSRLASGGGEVVISQEDMDAIAEKGTALLEGVRDGNLVLKMGSLDQVLAH